MRHNAFGDAYCHSVDDVDTIMAKNDIYYGDIHAEVYLDEENPGMWMAEVRYNEDGDTAFWCENFADKEALFTALMATGMTRKDITIT